MNTLNMKYVQMYTTTCFLRYAEPLIQKFSRSNTFKKSDVWTILSFTQLASKVVIFFLTFLS